MCVSARACISLWGVVVLYGVAQQRNLIDQEREGAGRESGREIGDETRRSKYYIVIYCVDNCDRERETE